MTLKVRWSRRATNQLVAATDYLTEQRPGLGHDLDEIVRWMTHVIVRHPATYPRVPGITEGEVRRGLIRRFNYWLIYEVLESRGEIVILSLWHTSRRPEGWRRSR